MNACDDLMEFLEPDETVSNIVFGNWGWNGYREDTVFVPADKRGILLDLEEAKPMMDGWTFFCGYGAPQCYAANIWTNKRVIWVTQYDGSTRLDSAPRNPVAHMPDMPGG